jgi:MT0933-like antitoxin protein
MGMFDKLRRKAEKAVDEHGDKISKGIDKAAGVADDKTGGKRTGQIDKGAKAAKDALDKLDGRDDDIPEHRRQP